MAEERAALRLLLQAPFRSVLKLERHISGGHGQRRRQFRQRTRCDGWHAALAYLRCTSWPLGEEVSDAVLEAALHKAAGTKTGDGRAPEPDWVEIHRELKRKHVTLQVLWDEY